MNRLLPPACVLLATALSAGCDAAKPLPQTPAESFERAVTAYAENRYSEARAFFLKAESTSAAMGKRDLQLQAIVYQVRIASERGEVWTAVGRTGEGIRIAKSLGDFRAESELKLLEGKSLLEAGLHREAAAAFEEGRRIASTFQEKLKLIDAELSIGDVWVASTDPSRATEYFTRALQGAQTENDDVRTARSLEALARLFLAEGKPQEAANSVAQAVAMIDKSDEPVLAAELGTTHGRVLEALGNPNAALGSYREAVNILRRARTGRMLEAVILFRIGQLYALNRRGGDARKYFGDALEIARREGDRIAQYYLNVHALEADIRMMTDAQKSSMGGRIAQAYRQLAAQFENIMQPRGKAFADAVSGSTLNTTDSAEALQLMRRGADSERYTALQYFNRELHGPYIASMSSLRANLSSSTLLAAEYAARDAPFAAILTLEADRAARFTADLEGATIPLRHPGSRERVERLRQRGLELRLKAVEQSALSGISVAPSQQENAGILGEIAALEAAGDSVVRLHPNYAMLVRSRGAAFDDIQRFIPRGTVVIEYIDGGDVLHIVAISRSQAVVRTVDIPGSVVREEASEYVRLMLDPMVYRGEGGESSIPSMTRFAVLSTQLYNTLIRPVESILERGILVIASEVIGALPVHALERQNEAGLIDFVIQRWSVDYLSSWSALKFSTRPPSRLKTIVAFGNPGGKNWSVDYELRDIRSFFRNAEVFTAQDATWSNMIATKPDLLQVSSGFSRGLDLFGSFTVSEGEVTEETNDVSFLLLLTIDPPPVMLLTNQSGSGQELGPDHALLLRLNGTSDIFLNRWTADRRAAKFFSEFFFTHLSNGLAPGDAYRQALLNLVQIRESEHPRSWAQFFHFGTG